MKRFTSRLFAVVLAIIIAAPAFAAAPVDINTADAKTLAEALAGVGLGKAEAIVRYRNEHGPFKSIDALAKVKGIGPKLVARNRDAIVVGASAKHADSPPPR